MPSMVTVFIDGFFDEPASVARMFGLKVNQHEGVSSKNSRICQVGDLYTRGGGKGRGGGGTAIYGLYRCMCRCEGYGFQAVYSGTADINQSVWV